MECKYYISTAVHLIEKALNTVPSTVDKFVNGRQSELAFLGIMIY